MNEKDLRVIKTEQHIEQAFLDLLQIKSYRAITVQDILDTATINLTAPLFIAIMPAKMRSPKKWLAIFANATVSF